MKEVPSPHQEGIFLTNAEHNMFVMLKQIYLNKKIEITDEELVEKIKKMYNKKNDTKPVSNEI